MKSKGVNNLRDVLDNIINPGDFVIGMIVSRDSDGIRFGIANDKNITWGSIYKDKVFLKTSIVRNVYKIENLSEKELSIKNKIADEIVKSIENEERLKAEKKAQKRIPSKDLVVGKSYKGESKWGNEYIYLGYGTVTEFKNGYEEDSNEGFIYLNNFEMDEGGETRYLPTYYVTQSRKKLIKQIDDLNNFKFEKEFSITQIFYRAFGREHRLDFKLEWRA